MLWRVFTEHRFSSSKLAGLSCHILEYLFKRNNLLFYLVLGLYYLRNSWRLDCHICHKLLSFWWKFSNCKKLKTIYLSGIPWMQSLNKSRLPTCQNTPFIVIIEEWQLTSSLVWVELVTLWFITPAICEWWNHENILPFWPFRQGFTSGVLSFLYFAAVINPVRIFFSGWSRIMWSLGQNRVTRV